MGMPCEVNSILKLNSSQGYPEKLDVGLEYQASKQGYRIIPVDVPIPLVDEKWNAYADIVVKKLIWEDQKTIVFFQIGRIYELPFTVK